MKKQRIIIEGQVPAQKNSKKMSFNNGRPVLYTSKNVKDWQESAAWQLRSSQSYPGKVRLGYVFFVKDNRRRDLDNMIATVNDALVKAGIIEDDDWKHLSIGYAIGKLHKENPRVEVSVEEVGETS